MYSTSKLFKPFPSIELAFLEPKLSKPGCSLKRHLFYYPKIQSKVQIGSLLPETSSRTSPSFVQNFKVNSRLHKIVGKAFDEGRGSSAPIEKPVNSMSSAIWQSGSCYRVCVFGAGGVGGYIAARMAQCGAEVTVVARGAHLEAIQSGGLRLSGISGSYTAEVKGVNPGELASVGEVDLLVVACKSWQVSSIAPSLVPLLGRETLVMTTQNGVGAPEALAPHLPGGMKQILGGYMRIHSLIESPGHILHNGVPHVRLGTGPLPGAAEFVPAQLERLKHTFADLQGLDIVIEDDVWHNMWKKLSLIATYSGVCTTARCNVGEAVGCPETAELMRRCISECCNVARNAGVTFTTQEREQIFTDFQNLAKGNPENTPSLMRDMLAGQPSELYEQLGAIVQYAAPSSNEAAKTVDIPTMQTLYAALLPQERRHRAAQGMDNC